MTREENVGCKCQIEVDVRFEFEVFPFLQFVNDLCDELDIKLIWLEAYQLRVHFKLLTALLNAQGSVEHVGFEQAVNFRFHSFHVLILLFLVLRLPDSDRLSQAVSQQLDHCIVEADVVFSVNVYFSAELHLVIAVCSRVICRCDLLAYRAVHIQKL